jgi:hypothetical protein
MAISPGIGVNDKIYKGDDVIRVKPSKKGTEQNKKVAPMIKATGSTSNFLIKLTPVAKFIELQQPANNNRLTREKKSGRGKLDD